MHVFGVMCVSAMGSAHTVTLSEVGQGARRVGRTGWGSGRSPGAHPYSGEVTTGTLEYPLGTQKTNTCSDFGF